MAIPSHWLSVDGVTANPITTSLPATYGTLTFNTGGGYTYSLDNTNPRCRRWVWARR
jgi:VCBS repeat-containing protein